MEDSIILINNNDYGAAELKKTYNRSFREGLLLAILIHIAIIAIYLIVTKISDANAEENKIKFNKPGVFVDLDLPPPVNNEEPKIKPEEIEKVVKDLAALEPNPVAKEQSDKVLLKTQDELNNIQNPVSDKGDSVNYIASNNNGKEIPDTKIDNNIVKEHVITDKPVYKEFEVEVAPECVNLQQVRNSIVYPGIAQESGIEGKVTIQVVVGEDGSVVKVGAFSGNEIFKDEVREKCRGLVFKPGLQNNKPVKVQVTVPFSFKLKN